MNYSLYIHIPFCTHRCAYCDFNTYAGQEEAIPPYVEAVRREIAFIAAQAPARLSVHTIFFGGGTPSLLAPSQFNILLGEIRSGFDVAVDAEITTEANPGTVALAGLEGLRAAGINRISFGAQSANGEELRMLERAHTFLDVIQAVSSARRAGFDNLNLDLIHGLPEQRLDTWQTSVQRVIDLRPEHISAYALTLEHGTPFGRWAARGLLPTPDPDAAADMYEWAGEAFEAAGYGQYEISNWAMKQPAASRQRSGDGHTGVNGVEPGGSEWPEFACRHNLQYWRCKPYLGFGAGAHGYADGYRYSNVLRIKTYIDRMSGEEIRRRVPQSEGGGQYTGEKTFPLAPAAVNRHRQSLEDDMSEFMITGLRLTREGIAPATFQERFGREVMQVYGKQVEELVRLGLLEWAGKDAYSATKTADVLRLTRRGRLLGNQVFLRFV